MISLLQRKSHIFYFSPECYHRKFAIFCEFSLGWPQIKKIVRCERKERLFWSVHCISSPSLYFAQYFSWKSKYSIIWILASRQRTQLMMQDVWKWQLCIVIILKACLCLHADWPICDTPPTHPQSFHRIPASKSREIQYI